MKLNKSLFSYIIMLFSFTGIAQNEKITVSGTIFEKSTKTPLEYATVVLKNLNNPTLISGGITNEKGDFNFEVDKGTYQVSFEFISFKTLVVKSKILMSNTAFDAVYLESDISQLQEVVVIGEVSTVEFKLDKRVYNVGQDMIVKGGTMSDVLNNVPSVTVDPDGTIALRGNENVRILIDGKPSGLAGINVADALKLLPADSVQKIELITNPSARYDAEGSGGIINIILRKGKAQGINGSFVASVSDPESYSVSSNLNYRGTHFNLFSNLGYNYRNSPGNSKNNSQYFDGTTGQTIRYIDEQRTNNRLSNGYNANLGIDLFLNTSTNWTHSLTFNKSNGSNSDDVYLYNFDELSVPTFTRNRFNDELNDEFSIEYASNFTKQFTKEDHKLTIDVAVSENKEDNSSIIFDRIIGDESSLFIETTLNNEKQKRKLIQADYVLPIGEDGRFETGYRGSFQENLTDFRIEPNTLFSNTLEYNEYIHALYIQYGNKIKNFSYFFGLRYEDSNIDVNSITSNDYNTKKYNNFFPTATLNYDINDDSNISISYSKRINRPRGRFLNPFSSYSSNINIFQGNPDLNPSFTDAYEIGFLKKWGKITLNSSAYANYTNNSTQFIRKESGLFVDNIPVILSTPINLAKETRMGFEFNVNYNPTKWWKLNGNFNIFKNKITGDYSYVNYLDETINQNFDNEANSWFTRISSKISLPYKIDWQTNVSYRAAQQTAQGKRLDMTDVNLAFSKDVLKDKGTIALNVSDLFNMRKRRYLTYIPNLVSSYSEYQWRLRQVTLAFTYRFNKKKERENQKSYEGGGEEMI
ncbi:TonB-dependent receptor [uncultured Flavobacterium sp.]|uniref:TonB-dependent receptor domain-containing protein n=1 Tax=uncultured Flavobacterium sp. TaxID=165435 RepID=UPI0030CA2902